MMASSPARARIPWGHIHFFWGDERCVPPDDPQSNFGMAWESLLSRVPAAQDHIHRMLGEMEDTDKAARRYEAEILGVIPGPREPSFDLVLLGMGEDGHTASLFPATEWDEERLVVANYVPKLGSSRISMTPRLLNAAREVTFLVSGTGKAKVLARVLEGPRGVFPAQRIVPARGSLTWMVDGAAAENLRCQSAP
jgi:6-phosphogluconolactonase